MIGGVAVGGLDRAAAQAKLERRLLDPLREPIVVKRWKRSWRLTAREARISADIEGSVDAAIRRSREGFFVGRAVRDLTGGEVQRADRAAHELLEGRRAAARRPRAPRPRPRRRARRASRSRRRRSSRSPRATAGRSARAACTASSAPRSSTRAPRGPSSPACGAPIRNVTTADLAEKYPTIITVDRKRFPLRCSRTCKAKTYKIAVGQAGLETPAGTTRPGQADRTRLARAGQRLGRRARRQGDPAGARRTRSRRAGWASTTAPASTAPTRSARSAPPPRTAASGWRSRTSRSCTTEVPVGTPVYIAVTPGAGVRQLALAPISSTGTSSQPRSSREAWWSPWRIHSVPMKMPSLPLSQHRVPQRRRVAGPWIRMPRARRVALVVGDRPPRPAGAAWRPDPWTLMKKTPCGRGYATPSCALPGARAGAARRRPARAAARPRRRAAPTASTSASSRAGRRAPGVEPRRRSTARPAPLRRARCAASAARAPTTVARKLAVAARVLRDAARARRARRRTPPTSSPRPSAARSLPRVAARRTRSRRCSTASRPTPLELRDRALFELAYACGLRCEELVNLDVGVARLRRRGAARPGQGLARRASCRSASRRSARSSATSSAAARRSPASRDEPALFLSKSGRRLSTSDVRRRLRRLGARTPALAGRRLAARAAALVRHAPARGRRGPARDPGAARPRERLDDPDLHSGRVSAAAQRVSRAATRGRRLRGYRPSHGCGDRRQGDRAQGPLARYKKDGDEQARERLVRRLLAAGQVRRRPDASTACPRTSRRPT